MDQYAIEDYHDEVYDYDALTNIAEQDSPRILGLDPRFILFVMFLGIKSFLPGIRDGWHSVGGVWIRATQILLVVMGVVFLLVKPFLSKGCFYTKQTKRFFFYPLLFLGLFEVISLTWSGLDAGLQRYLFTRPLFMCAALLGSVFVVSGLTAQRCRRFLNQMSFFLALVMLVYMGLSFIFPSLRISYRYQIGGIDIALGWIRVHGPLVAASTIGVLLLPVIAYCIGMFYTVDRARLRWLILAILFIVTAITSGSRACLVGLAFLFVLLAITFTKKAIKFIAPVIALVVAVIAIWGIPERFRGFHDEARLETYKTGMRAFFSTPGSMLIGHGHGRFYRAIDPAEERFTIMREIGVYIRHTEFGPSLVNSHSTYVQTLAETGIVGFLLILIPLLWLARRCFGARYRMIKSPQMLQARITLVGGVATFALMALDAYIIRNFWVFVVWAVYVVGAAEMVANAEYEFHERHDYALEGA